MKKLRVVYNGWGERWPLGTLADSGNRVLFEYAPQALERGLQLSPILHPLPRPGAPGAARPGDRAFHGLPGFIADSLPDGWGMLLMDRALRRCGRDPSAVSILERLAVIGDGAIGALSFEPAEEMQEVHATLKLRDIARHVMELQAQDEAVSHDAEPGLLQLLRLGGSPQGARPKVLVDFNPRTAVVSAGLPLTGATTPWLVKFPAQYEHRECSALEELYARIARKGGVEMPRSRFFDLGAKLSAFGVERFDRVVAAGPDGGKTVQRVPVMSLSAMLEADHRLPSLDYESFLRATLRITGAQGELVLAFERCVYNVLLSNRDDHSRNFAFRMDAQGLWKLSPAFDLTFSSGPGGEHSTSVLGHGKNITRAHLMELASRTGIAPEVAQERIDAGRDAVGALPKLLRELPIRKTTQTQLRQRLGEIDALLA